MAALALLFAIHSYRPSPFFVLDEVGLCVWACVCACACVGACVHALAAACAVGGSCTTRPLEPELWGLTVKGALFFGVQHGPCQVSALLWFSVMSDLPTCLEHSSSCEIGGSCHGGRGRGRG